jgi:hypothetical protein
MRTLLFLTILSFSFSGLFSQSLSDSLLLHYDFSNGVANDQSGNGYHATVYASPCPDQHGIPNNAMHFNGIDEYIELPNGTNLKPPLPLSFAYYVKFDTLNYRYTYPFTTDYLQDSYSGLYSGFTANEYIVIGYGDGGHTDPNHRRTKTSVASIVIDTAHWYLIVGVIRGAQDMDLYVDCEEVTGNYSGSGGPISYSSNPGTLGLTDWASEPPRYFYGTLSEVWYWNREITPYDVNMICDYLTKNTETNITDSSIKIYPNPSNGNIELKTSKVIESIKIYNELGLLILIEKEKSDINISDYPNGIYYLHITTDNNSFTKKVVKQ